MDTCFNVQNAAFKIVLIVLLTDFSSHLLLSLHRLLFLQNCSTWSKPNAVVTFWHFYFLLFDIDYKSAAPVPVLLGHWRRLYKGHQLFTQKRWYSNGLVVKLQWRNMTKSSQKIKCFLSDQSQGSSAYSRLITINQDKFLIPEYDKNLKKNT